MPMVRKRLTVLVEVDTEAQAAYIYFSGEPGQVRVKRTLPCGRQPFDVLVDLDGEGRLVGVEVLALRFLPQGVLESLKEDPIEDGEPPLQGG